MSNGEKIIDANGVDLCVETFGDAADPAILLIHRASASMPWWEEEFRERISATGRYVIRFDNRDTGRSASYPPGQPGYALTDMVGDAMGILDALGIVRALRRPVDGRRDRLAGRAAPRRPGDFADSDLHYPGRRGTAAWVGGSHPLCRVRRPGPFGLRGGR